MEHTTHSRVLKWAFIIGIIVVLNLLFNVGVELFYERPEWEDFCGSKEPVVEVPNTQEECVAAGGQWVDRGNPPGDGTPFVVPVDQLDPDVTLKDISYCDEDFTCRQQYEDARDEYEQTVFVILVVLGLLAVIAGLVTKQWEVVSSGLSLGGVLSFIVASMRYWESAPDVVRFLILVVALAVLIWFGVKKFKQ